MMIADPDATGETARPMPNAIGEATPSFSAPVPLRDPKKSQASPSQNNPVTLQGIIY
jgi:hypothetical protein